MSSYLIRRLAVLVPTVVAALSLLFVLLPGDPALTDRGDGHPVACISPRSTWSPER